MPLAAESTTVDVTYDARHGYVATHPQLPAPVIALSLSALRARVGRRLDIAGSERAAQARPCRPPPARCKASRRCRARQRHHPRIGAVRAARRPAPPFSL
jgi:hypothetical protein